jgi:metal-responsive CopG/Arc/MetJ family transcriptional regulator
MARTSAISVLQKKEKTQQLQVRIGEAVIESLMKLDERIKKEAPEMEFNRSEVVEKALRDAVREANSALDEMRKNGGAQS